ncbi:hypothetical protein JXC34_02820 [Candidatus Woesearchaeota archaeon]|nr:hypothetical protein [Candidatus Woesearchaeota archaeon]
MGFFRTLTLVFLSFSLILSLTVSIVGVSMQKLLYADVYERVFENNKVYSYIEESLGDSMPVTPKFGIRGSVTRVLRNTLDYLRGEARELNLSIPMNTTIDSSLIGQLADLPVCEEGEEDLVQGGEMRCRPADLDVSELTGRDMSSLDVSELLGLGSHAEQLREGIGLFRKAIYASLLLSLVNILFIVFLNRRSIPAIVEWVDADLFFVAILMIGLNYYVKMQLSMLVDLLPFSIPLLEGILTDIVFVILDTMMFYGFILVGVVVFLAVVGLILGLLMRKKVPEVPKPGMKVIKKKK